MLRSFYIKHSRFTTFLLQTDSDGRKPRVAEAKDARHAEQKRTATRMPAPGQVRAVSVRSETHPRENTGAGADR